MKRFIFILVFICCCAHPVKVFSQNMYAATNLLGYLNFVTINAEFGLSPTPKWSVYIRGKYNPFTFNFNKQMQNRIAGVYVGARYWFWYSNAGWFVNSHLGYSKYNTAGIYDKYAYQGTAYSLTAAGGYSLMLSRKLNMEFALGVAGGYTDYTKFMCPKCGRIADKKKKIFVSADNVLVQLSLLL